MIECPTAMSWDEQGRMYVLEMRGYMHSVEGEGEDQPNGIISILEDTNGDGKADKRTLFADGLVAPRAICAVNGGALVGEPPTLWFMKDTNGDGKADVKEVVESSFGSRAGQPEHMANSPTRFLDNWVYVANHPVRYKLKDGKWIADSVPGRGQWGMTQDNYGRPFYNFNSDFLRANFVPEALYKRNPNWVGGSGTGVQIVKDQSTWPIAPTPGVNRGYEKNALTDDGKLRASTATCGAAIYRGGLKEFGNDAYVPEPAGNLVKRFTLTEKDGAITGANALDKQEFLASTDERFRPVTAYTGPDGALYLADMYRGIIQHKGFLTHYLIANIKDRNLEQPFNMGRIWRVVPEGAKLAVPKLPAGGKELAAFLAHPNGWVRDTAQRLIVERKDLAVVPAVAELVKKGTPLAKIHALWTLEGLGAATLDVVAPALKDEEAKVRSAGSSRGRSNAGGGSREAGK
jgi:glucose/arabinose dehydrogenase